MIAEAMRTRTDAEALAYWKTNNGQLANQPADHAKLKEAIARHRQALRARGDDGNTIDMEPPRAPRQAPAAAPVEPPADMPPPLTDEELDFQRSQGAQP
jgi:recombination protein RecT